MRACDRSGLAAGLLVMPGGPVTPVYIAKRPIIVLVKVIIACYYLTGRLTPSPGRAGLSFSFCMVMAVVLLHSDDAIIGPIIPISPW